MKRGEASSPRPARRASGTALGKPAAARREKRQRPRPATVTRTCSHCGTTAVCPEGGMPSAWTMTVERRGVEFLCAGCARANIRAIEGKLPEEYWE